VKLSTISRPAAACAAAIVLAACASSSSSSSGGGGSSGGGPVTYGVLSCFTGRLASLGQAMLQGAQVAKAEINSAGGVLGRQVQLVTGDTSCDVADGVTATNQMLTKNVSGVIGPETHWWRACRGTARSRRPLAWGPSPSSSAAGGRGARRPAPSR
jgi:ABC-type branched-subunit amino acid transport system substrate-binding protein